MYLLFSILKYKLNLKINWETALPSVQKGLDYHAHTSRNILEL